MGGKTGALIITLTPEKGRECGIAGPGEAWHSLQGCSLLSQKYGSHFLISTPCGEEPQGEAKTLNEDTHSCSATYRPHDSLRKDLKLRNIHIYTHKPASSNKHKPNAPEFGCMCIEG